jgi:PD-(D/E)XK nuclease superfamily
MNKLHINLDSTSLGTSGCILNFIRTVVGDLKEPEKGAYREKVNNVRLNYGIAVHKFIDLMYKTRGDIKYARDVSQKWFIETPHIPIPKKAWMSDPRHLLVTCYQVWTTYVEQDSVFEILSIPGDCVYCEGTASTKVEDGPYCLCPKCNSTGQVESQSATEVTFSIPFFRNDIVDVSLCGTIDRVGKFKNGIYCIRDWKTTGSWNDATYFIPYELSRQLRVYTLACKMMSQLYPDSIMGQIGKTQMGAAIDAVFLKENANQTECKMSPVYTYTDRDIEQFKQSLISFCQKISYAVENNLLPQEGIMNGSCESKWGKCSFWVPCKLNNDVTKVILNRDFRRVKYEPLKFND